MYFDLVWSTACVYVCPIVSVGFEYESCLDLILWEKRTAILQGYELDASNMGGWTLDKHHILDLQNGRCYDMTKTYPALYHCTTMDIQWTHNLHKKNMIKVCGVRMCKADVVIGHTAVPHRLENDMYCLHLGDTMSVTEHLPINVFRLGLVKSVALQSWKRRHLLIPQIQNGSLPAGMSSWYQHALL